MAKARFISPALALFVYAVGLGFSQPPAQSNARYILRGSVVNSVTGEPIHKAMVTVNGSQAKNALTGADGQFQFDALPAGSYFVAARRPGYADWSTLGHPLSPYNLGPDTGPLTLKLAPLAKISGRVLDSDGEPVPNLNVQILQQKMFQAGHKHWQPAQGAITDDTGDFLVDSLQPGKYLLASREQQVYPGLIAEDQASRLIYRKQFYPNSFDISAAQPIELSPGENAQADLTVATVRGTRVFFSVVPQQPRVRVTLRDGNGDRVDAQLRRNIRAGGWILPSIPPGPWQLDVEANGNGEQLSGSTSIEVGDSDLKNVVVSVSPPHEVPLIFSGRNDAEGAAPSPNIELIPLSAGNRPGFWSGQNPSEKRQAIFSAEPGSYRVLVHAGPSQCVQSITAGSSDLTRVDYVVLETGSPRPINFGVSSDCASLDLSANKPWDRNFVAVIVGGLYALQAEVIYAGSNNLKFAAGEYDIYAFSNVNALEYANPEVLKNYAGQHVTLSANQTATLRITVNDLDNTDRGEGN